MNHKPDRALATLQATRVADLSNDLRDQRLLLEARAMSNLGRHDLALELITNINSREAMRLRRISFGPQTIGARRASKSNCCTAIAGANFRL